MPKTIAAQPLCASEFKRAHLEIVRLIFDTGQVDESILSNALSLLSRLAKGRNHNDVFRFLSAKEQAGHGKSGVLVVFNVLEHPMYKIVSDNNIRAAQEYVNKGGNVRVREPRWPHASSRGRHQGTFRHGSTIG